MKQIVFAGNPELRGMEKYRNIFRTLRDFSRERKAIRKGSASGTPRFEEGFNAVFTIKAPSGKKEYSLKIYYEKESRELNLCWVVAWPCTEVLSSPSNERAGGSNNTLEILKALAKCYQGMNSDPTTPNPAMPQLIDIYAKHATGIG